MRHLLVVVVAVLGFAGTAHAYPQFQLSRDQTCSNCHLSPAGGGMLNENGLNTADAISQLGTAPEFMYGKLPLPSWLTLGGDLRGAAGLDNTGLKTEATVFPMQAELYINAALGNHLALHVTAGARDPQDGDTASTLFASREHWLQWQENPGEGYGMFLRVGRFMPVYGLRFVEHPDYTRRFGGTPLYGETYGAAAEYIQPRYEIHATGFIRDPILTDSINQGNGVALYAEVRPTETTSVGIEGMFMQERDDERWFGGMTAKHMIGANLLLEAEVQTIYENIDAGGSENQLVAYGMGSYFHGAFMVDLGLGYFNENLAVKGLDRDGIDLNIHWFTTSHIELLLTNRLQFIEFGEGGTNSGYSLLQLHYRL